MGRIGGKVVRLEIEALFSPFDHRLRRINLSLTNGSGSLDINDDAELDINEIIIGIGKECWPAHRSGPLRGWIGRRHELRCHIAAAPNAASSRVARYSLVARLAVSARHVFFHSVPGIERCLLASATIRLASTAKPSPPTKPAAIQASTTRSKTRRNISLSRNRSWRMRENAE